MRKHAITGMSGVFKNDLAFLSHLSEYMSYMLLTASDGLCCLFLSPQFPVLRPRVASKAGPDVIAKNPLNPASGQPVRISSDMANFPSLQQQHSLNFLQGSIVLRRRLVYSNRYEGNLHKFVCLIDS